MTIRGHIEHGNVVLDEPVELPEGLEVTVAVAPAKRVIEIHPDVQRVSGIFNQPVGDTSDYYEALGKKHRCE